MVAGNNLHDLSTNRCYVTGGVNVVDLAVRLVGRERKFAFDKRIRSVEECIERCQHGIIGSYVEIPHETCGQTFVAERGFCCGYCVFLLDLAETKVGRIDRNGTYTVSVGNFNHTAAQRPGFGSAARFRVNGIGDADDALAHASGRPCQIIDEKRIETDPEIDSKIKEQLLMLSSLPKQVRDDLLRVLSMGRDLPLDRIAVKDGRTALPVAAVLPVIYRWGYDLLAVQQGLKPHYFPQYGESRVKILKGVKTEHLYAWFDTLKSLQRTVNHPLNAQLVIEQTLLRYRRMMMGKAFD